MSGSREQHTGPSGWNDDNHPPITVGILTVPGREELFDKLLQSLEVAASNYPGKISVRIATPEPNNTRCLTRTYDLTCRYIETNGTAPKGRQNIIESTPTEWLLFLDDDCTVEEDIFFTYARTLRSKQENNLGAIYGRIEFAGKPSAAFEACEVANFIYPFRFAHSRQAVEWAPMANALLNVPAVKKVGGFDTSNPIRVSGEDVDLGIRLSKSGYESLTEPEAVAHHALTTWNDFWGNIRRFYVYGKSEAWLSTKYPNRRQGSVEVPSRSRIIYNIFAHIIHRISRFILSLDPENRLSARTVLISGFAIAYILCNTFGYYRQSITFSGDLAERLRTRFRFEPIPTTSQKEDIEQPVVSEQ